MVQSDKFLTWLNSLQTIDCPDCAQLLAGWMAGDVPTREICAHIHGCEITQARLSSPVEVPNIVLEGVTA